MLISSMFNRNHFRMQDTILERLKNEDIPEYALSTVREYFYHSILYASDDVLLNLKTFLNQPRRDNFLKVAKSMRIDLWNKKSNVSLEDLIITD